MHLKFINNKAYFKTVLDVFFGIFKAKTIVECDTKCVVFMDYITKTPKTADCTNM